MIDAAMIPGAVPLSLNRDQTVWLDPESASNVKAATLDAMRVAAACQGPRAFEAPRYHAAIHEAGHAVTALAGGEEVRCVRVYRRRHEFFPPGLPRLLGLPSPPDKMLTWQGTTLYARDADHNVPADASVDRLTAHFRRTLSGWVAELSFLKDFRLGSSIDELMIAGLAAEMIAYWTGETKAEVMDREAGSIGAVLMRNEDAVWKIASYLMSNKEIRREKLSRIVGGVA